MMMITPIIRAIPANSVVHVFKVGLLQKKEDDENRQKLCESGSTVRYLEPGLPGLLEQKRVIISMMMRTPIIRAMPSNSKSVPDLKRRQQ